MNRRAFFSSLLAAPALSHSISSAKPQPPLAVESDLDVFPWMTAGLLVHRTLTVLGVLKTGELPSKNHMTFSLMTLSEIISEEKGRSVRVLVGSRFGLTASARYSVKLGQRLQPAYAAATGYGWCRAEEAVVCWPDGTPMSEADTLALLASP